MKNTRNNEINQWFRDYLFSSTFLNEYPYYAYILARFLPIEDSSVNIMAVSSFSENFFLHVNINFFLQNPLYLKGVLLHEVHHVVLGHLSHPKFYGSAHPDLMETAMEISANEHIKAPLPGSPVLWQDYKGYGIRQGQSTLQRYELLVKARMENNAVIFSPGSWSDDHHVSGIGAIHLQKGVFSENREGVRVCIERAIEEAEKTRQEKNLPPAFLAGKTPGNILEDLSGMDEKPEFFVDWKTAMQIFLSPMRSPVHTYSRPNRRFLKDVGKIPGRIYSPNQWNKPSVLVAIDTSSSMSIEDLSEVARQLLLIKDLARITIVECDREIQRVYPFAGQIDNVKGRGGTDLRPVFDSQFLREHKNDGIIYFTDGEGPYLKENPKIKTLWVLTGPQTFSCPWGEKAFFEKRERIELDNGRRKF